MKRLPAAMKKNKNFYAGIVLNILEGLLSGANFIILYYLFIAVFEGNLQMSRLLLLAGIMLIVFILRAISYTVGYICCQIGGASISKNIRLALGNKMKKIPLGRFMKGQTGEYINITTTNVSDYEVGLTHKVGDTIKQSTLAIMLIAYVFTLWYVAGLIMLVAALLMFPALLLSTKLVAKYGNKKVKICAENVSSIVEYTSGIQTLRAYGMGGEKNKTVTKAMKDYSDICYIYEAKVIPVGTVLGVITWLSLPLVLCLGYSPMINGEMSVVTYVILALLPLFMCKLLANIFVNFTAYKNYTISRKKIETIFEEKEEQESSVDFMPQKHDIAFTDVNFSYVKGEPVLKGASFTAKDNELTAIVGASGSGKSTILNLISKYYAPDGGQIKIGGIDTALISSEKVLSQISMVDQDVFLFNDTVRNNIRYARQDATDEEVEQACRLANCDEFIRALNNGYDTSTGENGILLSGGERQRLSIARAILKDSPIILLDEATASLDIENELVVKQAIANLLSKKKTVIIIAHTLSIVRNADKILVVDNGKIAEEGTHDELLAKNGRYADMWEAEQKLIS